MLYRYWRQLAYGYWLDINLSLSDSHILCIGLVNGICVGIGLGVGLGFGLGLSIRIRRIIVLIHIVGLVFSRRVDIIIGMCTCIRRILCIGSRSRIITSITLSLSLSCS